MQDTKAFCLFLCSSLIPLFVVRCHFYFSLLWVPLPAPLALLVKGFLTWGSSTVYHIRVGKMAIPVTDYGVWCPRLLTPASSALLNNVLMNVNFRGEVWWRSYLDFVVC